MFFMMIYRFTLCIFFGATLMGPSLSLMGAVKSKTGIIYFDSNGDGAQEATLNSTGFGIGTAPSANLHVSGNGIITNNLSVGSSSAGSSNLMINGTLALSPLTVSGNLDLTRSTNLSSLYLVDSRADNLAFTLPRAVDVTGTPITVKKISSSHDVVILGGGGLMDNQYDISLTSGNTGSLTVLSDGSRWHIFDSMNAIDTTTSFIFKVNTALSGTSGATQFTIPLYSGQTYNFTASYDGTSTAHSTDSDLTLTFPSGSGIYDVSITGTFAGLKFNNGGDCLKIIDIVQWGNVEWKDMNGAFFKCNNMAMSALDVPHTSAVTDFTSAFRDCDALTAIPFMDTSNATILKTFVGFSSGLTSFPFLNTSNCNRFNFMFSGCTGLNGYDIPTLDLRNMTDGNKMFDSVAISTQSWSDLLVSTNANNSNSGVIWSGGSSMHNASGNTAINTLITDHAWAITDGGQ
jgi:hypothetical protein